jgi:hypothetical protein
VARAVNDVALQDFTPAEVETLRRLLARARERLHADAAR